MNQGIATIPFVFPKTVVLIKEVPAEICANCHEPYTTGRVTDNILEILQRLRAVPTEVSIVSYVESESRQPIAV